MVLICGIDPGKHHLGLCVYDDEQRVILDWEVIRVDDSSASSFVRSVEKTFQACHLHHCSNVYIERQPPQNSSMCRVQHYLQMYLELRMPMCEVSIIQAAKRTRFLKSIASSYPGTLLFDTYAQRKRSSVNFVQHILKTQTTTCSEDIRSRFESATKRDDFAESFLLAYIHALERRDQE
jgi:hypothetical protein